MDSSNSSTFWVIIYSKFSQASTSLLDMIRTVDLDVNFKVICIDNKAIRTYIQKSTKFNIQTVPCILHIDKFTGIVQQYEGQNAFEVIASMKPVEYNTQYDTQTGTKNQETPLQTSLDDLGGDSSAYQGAQQGIYQGSQQQSAYQGAQQQSEYQGAQQAAYQGAQQQGIYQVSDQLSDRIPERVQSKHSILKQKVSASDIMSAQTSSIEQLDKRTEIPERPVMEVKKTGKPINIAEVMSEAQRQSQM